MAPAEACGSTLACSPLPDLQNLRHKQPGGEEGTGGGLGPLRKAVVVSRLRVALREARGGDQGDLGAGHSWPCSSHWGSNGPGPRLGPVSGRPDGRVPGGVPPPWNLPRPRLPVVRRSRGSHKQAFLQEGNRGGESARKQIPRNGGGSAWKFSRRQRNGTRKAVGRKERAPSVSVALRAQLGPKGGWKVRDVLGSKRFQLMIIAAQLEEITDQCILKMLYSMRLSHTHVCLSEMAKLLMALCTARRDRLIAYCLYVAMLRGKPNGHTQ